MKTRWLGVAAAVAMTATVVSFARPQSTTADLLRASSSHSAGLPVAGQLPRGFTLPSADVDLKVSTLITTDLDADGDLDIVAADRSGGVIGIVVWVNDGAGRLTRKAPAPTGKLASEPADPSIDERQATVMASVQPDGPAIAAIAANAWMTLPARPYELTRPAVPPSVSPATLRSRSPPILS